MSKKIMLVINDSARRQELCDMLGEQYSVTTAAGNVGGLSVLHQEDYCALLLDDENGFEMLIGIRENAALAGLPVIIFSVCDDDETRQHALTLGADDFIAYPLCEEAIRHCIKNAIMRCAYSPLRIDPERDKLTGLYSREAFLRRVEEMVSSHPSGHYTMACCDIVHFKIINDQYGAQKGDEVLRHIAHVLHIGIGRNDGLCSRLFADNFAILYPTVFRDTPEIAALQRECALVDGLSAPLTFSIGRYRVDDISLSSSDMFDRAQLAADMIRDCADLHIMDYDETMRNNLLHEQKIVSEMRNALETGQFEAWFQPQYNHATGALIGAEALVRWRHPQRGLVPPDEFIPIFERNGFIFTLDKYIWGEVCRFLRAALDEGVNPLPVSVNISRYDMAFPELVTVLTDLLQEYTLPIELLRLEITESAFTESAQLVVDVVRRLTSIGFTVEIDDFGSGYSSLNTLKDVPAQIVKLDMKFLQGSDNLERGGNIISSVVRMAKWLGMSVIAEGVETIEQANYLKSIGCLYMQGYLFARPMPLQQYRRYCGEAAAEEHLLTLETVENLNNNAFWDPSSMDTLIFNSYVGGACILEYTPEGIELVRATDEFIGMLGCNMTVADAMRIDWMKHLEAKSALDVKAKLVQSAASKKQVSGEFVFIDLPGCSRRTYIRTSMRVIAMVGERMLVYCLNDNITAQRSAEQKIVVADEQIRFLNDMSRELLEHPDAIMGIDALLKKLLEYFQSSRTFILEFNSSSEVALNTYEACAKSITSAPQELRAIPLCLLEPWLEGFSQQGFYAIENVDSLPKERELEKNYLQQLGVKFVFAAPLYRDKKLIGMIGVVNPARRLTNFNGLAALGDYIAVMLIRRDLNARINSDRETLATIMNDTPGGFARLRIMPDNSLHIVFANDTLCRMRGMTLAEIRALENTDAMVSVHPDDRGKVRDTLRELLKSGDTYNIHYRLRNGDGYSVVNVFGRASKGTQGEIFINAYYTEMLPQDME